METETTDTQSFEASTEKRLRLTGLEIVLLVVHKLSVLAQAIAGVTLVFMMAVTLGDVVLRAFGRPIMGAYEIISFCGGIVIGLAIPYTSWMGNHIYVDMLVQRSFRKKGDPINKQDIVNIITRCAGIALFILIGWSFFGFGTSLQASREVSATLRIPFYPVAYGLGVSSFIQSILLFCDILKIAGGENE